MSGHLLFIVTLGAVLIVASSPASAEYRAAFADPPWTGGWSDGSSSQGEITVWRPSTSGSATVTVDLIWTLGIEPDDTASMLEAAFADASAIGTAQASFSSGSQTTSVTLQTDPLTAPQNVPYFLWISVDGQVVQALDGSLQTRDLWVVFHSPGYNGPETAVTIEDSDLAINARSATLSGEVVLQPAEAYSRWRTSYRYRVLFDNTSMAGPNDFASGIALISEPDDLPTTPNIDPNPISAPLRAPWDWPSGNLDMIIEVARYDALGAAIDPETNEFGVGGNTVFALNGCADLAAASGLSASPQGTGQYPIAWIAVSGATGYLLRIESGGSTELAEVSANVHTYTFTAGTTYEIAVRAYAECAGGMRSYGPAAAITVTSGGPPEAAFTFTVGEYVENVGFAVEFTDQSSGLGALSYAWDFGDGGTSTEHNPAHTYAQGGCYQVGLTVSNSYGSGSAAQTVSTPVAGVAFDWTREAGSDAIGFTTTVTGEPASNFSWAWDFGDGNTDTTGEPSHEYDGPGVYPVTLTATHCDGLEVNVVRNVAATLATQSTVSDEFAAGGSTYKHLIPAAARTAGAGGSKWASDVAVLNPGGETAEVRLYMLPSENNSAKLGRRLEVATGASTTLEDFFGIFAVDAAAGGVLVASDDLLVITSRTFNTDPAGTFGQFIPAVPILGAVRAGEHASLIQLTQDGQPGERGLRSNIGVLNVTGEALRVTADLYGAGGEDLGVKNRTLQPFAYYQWNQVFGAGVDTVLDAYAMVTSAADPGVGTGANTFFTYASVVDNITGDPVYVEPPRLLTPDRPGYVPAAARAAGVGGSFWRTDLEVHNPAPGAASYRLALLATGSNNSSPQVSDVYSLPAGTTRRFSDVLGEVFSYDGSAAIRVEVLSGNLMASSRTFTDRVGSGGGTYGQYIPCYPFSEGVLAGDSVYIPQLAEHGSADASAADYGGFRTNVGFVNLSDSTVPVRTVLFDGDGRQVKTRSYNLKPWEHKQLNRVFGESAEVENGYAVISPMPGKNEVDDAVLLAYASVVDNRSSDPVYIPGRSLRPAAAFTWSPESPGPGEDVYFVDRSQGYTTDWTWNFGSTVSSTERDPVHIFWEAGDIAASLIAENDSGATESIVDIHVSDCPDSVDIAPSTLPYGQVGVAYEQTLTASGGLGGPFEIFVDSGALPPGLALGNATDTAVDIEGTPTSAGAYPFMILAQGPGGCTGVRDYVITVGGGDCPPIIISEPEDANLGAFEIGNQVNVVFSAAGGSPPYTFSANPVRLPDGLILYGDGTLSGVLTAAGVFEFKITATDADDCDGGRDYSLTVNPGECPTITVTPLTLADATVGQSYSLSFSAAGSEGPYDFMITSGSLPPGLNLSDDGTLSGTPSQGSHGSYSFTVQATDINDCSGSVSLTLVVRCPELVFSPQALPEGTPGEGYDVQLSISGGQAPYSFELAGGQLPAGINLSAGGKISGTTADAGSFSFTVRATDSNACSAEHDYTLILTCSGVTITISPASVPRGQVGIAYSQGTPFSATGGSGPYDFAITGLPPGLQAAAGCTDGSDGTPCVIEGTPTQGSDGNHSLTVTASDTNGCAGQRQLTLAISCPAITVSPSMLPAGVVGTAYSSPLSASGGAAPYTFTLGAGSALPAGLSLSSDGTVNGTPTEEFSGTLEIEVADANGCAASADISLTITCPSVTISPTTLPNAIEEQAYSQSLSASGGTGPYSFALLSGSLPGGVTLSSSGTLSGTPQAGTQGDHSFTVEAVDSHGCEGARDYTLTVEPPPCGTITISPTTLPAGVVGTAYSSQLAASGGTAPYTFALAAGSVLPAGLNLGGDGALSGTPTETFSGTFDVEVTDADSCPGSASISLTIICPTVTISPTTLPNGTVNRSYSETLNASGGTAPYSFTHTGGTLPSGLSLASSGAVIGTPDPGADGSYSFTVQATDAHGCSGSASVSLTIEPDPLLIGLIAYYPLDGNALDASGNGLHGTEFNTVSTSDRFGNPNSAYQFNGTTTYIQVSHHPSLQPVQLTMAAWVKTPPQGGETYALSKGRELPYSMGTKDGEFRFRVGTSALSNATLSSSRVLDGLWHHVAGVYDGATFRIYVDGSIDGSESYSGGLQEDENHLNIGRKAVTANGHFDGVIDEVRIYDRALSGGEILDLYLSANKR